MSTIQLDLPEDLTGLLEQLDQTVENAARELMVLELYRRGTVSSGKAAELLQMTRWQFIQHASDLGIPFYALADAEWDHERAASEQI